jgi:hypothetical protein
MNSFPFLLTFYGIAVVIYSGRYWNRIRYVELKYKEGYDYCNYIGLRHALGLV